jgi:hypothetical protein
MASTMKKFIILMYELVNCKLKSCNHVIFAYKFSFFKFEVINFSILVFDFFSKLYNLIIFLLSNSLNKIRF